MTDWIRVSFWLSIILILVFIAVERIPQIYEGFQDATSITESGFWSKFLPRRGDVGPELEIADLKRDKRYFSDYTDIQRFGVNHDFCRMVQQGSDEKNKFFACALAGTENLSSTSYKTPSVREGFQLSRDDYMRDTSGSGRNDYCRILKNADGSFNAKCNEADDFNFKDEVVPDTNPPPEIQRLLTFYQGCVFWLRLRDDMLDYIQNLYINTAGSIEVDENEIKPAKTKGLTFNGIDQYLRIGDDSYLQFGGDVPLRSLRSISMWIKFDEFTNNAHIFDFGNGPGIDNVFLGIIGRGNSSVDNAVSESSGCKTTNESTVPESPSGAQDVPDMAPQRLMETTNANVEEWSCTGFAVAPRIIPKEKAVPKYGATATTADLLYEVWQSNNRKMHVVVPQFFKTGEWIHLTITAKTSDAFRPTLLFYKNGSLAFEQPNGWLPQTGTTKKNYIGKSNWADQTSQYGNRDELFKGALFDIRGYTSVLSEKVIKDTVEWGKGYLD
jgi:hypothetical protein